MMHCENDTHSQQIPLWLRAQVLIMCGIVGVLNLSHRPPVEETVLCQHARHVATSWAGWSRHLP